jgi:hypothetical protein
MTNTKITKKNEKEKKMTNTKITKKNEKEKKMTKEIFKEIKWVEQNPFVDPLKANNGGGYHQPLITFTFNGKTGSISDTSCGDFGHRIQIVYGDKEYYYDSVSREYIEYSTFSKLKHNDRQVVNEIKKHTGYKVCFKEDILEDQEYIDEDVIVDRNLSKGWKRKRHEATKN